VLNSDMTDINFKDGNWFQTMDLTTTNFRWSKFELQMQSWHSWATCTMYGSGFELLGVEISFHKKK
jgi:hypothetical protein